MVTLQIEPNENKLGQPGTIRVKGAFTSMDAIESRPGIINFINQQHGNTILDLSSIDSIDLAGINILAMAQRSAERGRKHLQIRIAREGKITEWIQMTKMDRLLNIEIVN